MNRRALVRSAAALGLALLASAAFAHAQLQSAVPPVGGTVASASALRLRFSEGLEPKFSGLTLMAEGGGAVAIGPVTVDPADARIMVIKIAKPLPVGHYTVSWRAVSVDTHRTQGSYDFTVKP